MKLKPAHPVQEDFYFLIIYRPGVSLVLCELLNAMVVCFPVVVGLLFVLVSP